MEEWHEILESTQGRMMTKAEKIKLVTSRLRKYGEVEALDVGLTVEQVTNKLDALSGKAKKAYGQFRRQTSTGSLVEDDFDRKVNFITI